MLAISRLDDEPLYFSPECLSGHYMGKFHNHACVGLIQMVRFISARMRLVRLRFFRFGTILESSRGEQISTACPKTSVTCKYLYAGRLSAKFSQISPNFSSFRRLFIAVHIRGALTDRVM